MSLFSIGLASFLSHSWPAQKETDRLAISLTYTGKLFARPVCVHVFSLFLILFTWGYGGVVESLSSFIFFVNGHIGVGVFLVFFRHVSFYCCPRRGFIFRKHVGPGSRHSRVISRTQSISIHFATEQTPLRWWRNRKER